MPRCAILCKNLPTCATLRPGLRENARMATKSKKLWTVAEAAGELSLPRRTLYRWLRQVDLPEPLLERLRDKATLLTERHLKAIQAFAEGVVVRPKAGRSLSDCSR